MNDPHQATREVLWNISHVWVMYALLVPTVAVGGVRHLSPRARLAARAEREPLRSAARATSLLVAKYALLQLRTWRKLYPGVMHAMIFWGFIVLTIATTVVMIDYDFGIPIMHGYFYLVFQSFIIDVFGALAIVGVGMAAARRWIARPQAAGLHARSLADPGCDLRHPGDAAFWSKGGGSRPPTILGARGRRLATWSPRHRSG